MSIENIRKRIVSPIINQLPFCVFLYMIWGGWSLLENLFSPLYAYSIKVFLINVLTLPFFFLFESFFFLYFFAFCIELVNRKWFTTFVYGFILILTTIEYFLRTRFEMGISPTALVLVGETNNNEANEFIQTFVLVAGNIPFFFKLITIIFLVYLIERFYNKNFFIELKRCLSKSIILFFFILCALSYSLYCMGNDLSMMLKNKNMDDLSGFEFTQSQKNPLTDLLYSSYGVYLMNKDEVCFEKNVNDFSSNDNVCQSDSALNVVVVIGESYIKHHARLYGYSLNTTPHLLKEQTSGNLFVFNNVITPYGYTSIAIKNMLCTNSISDGEKWNNSYYFPQIFKAAGYSVYFWDNQKTWEDKSTFAFALNTFLYNKTLISKVYSKVNTKSYTYDEDIVKSFKSEIISTKRNLVMFHLMGQHSNYNERFPKTEKFLYYTADSIKRNEIWMTKEKKQLIADYDNATRYNDYVLWQILNIFRDSETIVVYFSDHGEEVYDYRDSYGRSGSENRDKIKYLYQIPFMIWCSDSYIHNNPNHMRHIESAKDRPFMIDNLCHMLFDLGGIKTRYYNAERNILSPIFKPKSRIIANRIDYDSIMCQ